MKTVILYGSAGTGKTRYASEIATTYGCVGITDDWTPDQQMTPGHLHITQTDYSDAKMVMCDLDSGKLSDVMRVSIAEALVKMLAEKGIDIDRLVDSVLTRALTGLQTNFMDQMAKEFGIPESTLGKKP